jgi:hypothetical protein
MRSSDDFTYFAKRAFGLRDGKLERTNRPVEELLNTQTGKSESERIIDGICGEHMLRWLFLGHKIIAALPAGATIETRRHWRPFVHQISLPPRPRLLEPRGDARVAMIDRAVSTRC